MTNARQFLAFDWLERCLLMISLIGGALCLAISIAIPGFALLFPAALLSATLVLLGRRIQGSAPQGDVVAAGGALALVGGATILACLAWIVADLGLAIAMAAGVSIDQPRWLLNLGLAIAALGVPLAVLAAAMVIRAGWLLWRTELRRQWI